ncbi:hypothetical protein TBLA_0A09480 [Henningerozyma blattae CBS 6284]|uniref:5'-3' exoribonuclease n=1 Tax=Henningerozyma blattae (strain ATCC 34711 / CBS 6284 / DSM 70876 / NBRC 10599 / NRRL Y-10934 / UCD 77-7) TaxID=1071380 RepID=I2GX81_HENB6|nr:hypothetical protein TBLA_0A09480 [Tetrapisispora blattae CBS 6284]CCH58733.1 hypothetical protein TBLA_0A09480 [Tetrapisispora blattae CBS 6284]
MGVPSFFRWLSRKYPKIISPVSEILPQVVDGVTLPIDYSAPNPNGELDNLYLDMNGIVHPCSHPENKPAPETEDEMLLAVFEYTNRVLNMARPRKVLMIAVDGVAPRAKMNQQRARRFRSARDASIENQAREAILNEREKIGEIIDESLKSKKTWDSNAITPGTPFMDKLAAALRYWISFKLATDLGWKNLQVIISDATVPGEGEHKIMNFVRAQRGDPEYNPNTTHCIYGLDADLIFLGLATHEPHFKILREDVFAQDNRKKHKLKDTMNMTEEEKQLISKQDSEKPFLWLHLSVLREYLSAELFVPRLPFPFDLERAIDDWVFMCFFCGNDFLPHLPSLDVRENSIDILLDIWKTLLPQLKTYMTCDGRLDLKAVELLLQQVGSRESDIFRTKHIQQVRKKESLQRKNIRKSERRTAKDQDKQPLIPTEQLQLYDTHGNLAKGSWNLTTHDMVSLKKELMLANEGNPEAIKIIQAKSDENDKLMEELTKEQLDKAIDTANKNNMDVATIMKKKLMAKKRELEITANENELEEIEKKKLKTANEEDNAKSELNEKIIGEVVTEVEDNNESGLSRMSSSTTETNTHETTPDTNVNNNSYVPVVSNGPIKSGVIDTDKPTKLYEPGYKERYYVNKFHIKSDEIEALRKDMVKSYIEGVAWVLLYYYQGCASWEWFYPYHYAPLPSDFYGFSNMNVEFGESEPFLPFEQLMSVLPAASGHTLPAIFRPLMSSPDSEIIDFYPEEFPIDMNGKKMAWHGIALLPFIDATRLLKVVRDQYPKLTDAERSRNVRNKPILLISNKNVHFTKFSEKLYDSSGDSPKEINFRHFKSGLSGIVSKDKEGFKLNSKIVCPIEGGSLPDLSTNLILQMSYELTPLPSENKSILLNGFIPSEAMLTAYDFDAIRYKDNKSSFNHRSNNYNWKFNEEMKGNVVPVGPKGSTQYKPRAGGFRSFFYFNQKNEVMQNTNNNQYSGSYNRNGNNPKNDRYNNNSSRQHDNNRSRYNDSRNNYNNNYRGEYSSHYNNKYGNTNSYRGRGGYNSGGNRRGNYSRGGYSSYNDRGRGSSRYH